MANRLFAVSAGEGLKLFIDDVAKPVGNIFLALLFMTVGGGAAGRNQRRGT